MVCWLKFLKKVSDMLKDIEPNISRRKHLAISVLKELEREKGHNVVLIGKAIDEEGAEGIKRRAGKRGEKKRERAREEAVVAEA
jgi:hypothetical protein